MKRIVLPLIVAVGVLAAAPLAQANDASLKRALQPYKRSLTADISFLSNFTAPKRSKAGGVLRRLGKVRGDLGGATRAATLNKASSNSGRKGRTLVLSALHQATLAAGDARASANAARSGKRLAAKRAARKEQGEINKAIPLFERGGRLLHLF